MKTIWRLVMVVATAVLTGVAATDETYRIKADLIGQTMGGRENCWKFQSPAQIKQLEIKDQTESVQKRVCTVTMQLQATEACGKYAAEARVEYEKTAAGWRIKQVGLLSLRRIN